MLAGAQPARGRRHELPHHREGRRLRRHLVLEPLSRRAVRHRSLHLPAAAGRDSATCRRRSTPTAPRSSSTASASASTSASTTTPVPDRGRPRCAGTRRRALARRDQPRRRHPRAVRRHGAAARCTGQAARHPRHRRLQGPQLPHQPLGLRLHRRRHERADSTSSATSASAIIGTGATAIQCVPHLGRVGQAALRLPAHAVGGRRARQPADRSRLGEALKPGWQQRAPARTSTRGSSLRPAGRARTWSATAGPRSSATSPAQARGRRLAAADAGADRGAASRSRTTGMERIRDRVDDDRRGPGDRRGAEALVPLVVQAAAFNDEYLPTFNRPTSTLVDVSTPRASSASPRRASSPTASIRGRLHHLRQRLRDHQRPQAPLGHRRVRRARRPVAVRPLGRRLQDAARHSRHGFPEPVLHRLHPGRRHRQRDRMFDEQASTSPTSSPRREARRRRGGADREAQDAWVDTSRETAIDNSAYLRNARPATTTTRARVVRQARRSSVHLGETTAPASTPSRTCWKRPAGCRRHEGSGAGHRPRRGEDRAGMTRSSPRGRARPEGVAAAEAVGCNPRQRCVGLPLRGCIVAPYGMSTGARCRPPSMVRTSPVM